MRIIINAKTYKEATGKGAKALLKAAEAISGTIVCLQPSDLYLAKSSKVEVWAQHIDPLLPGSNTGALLPEAIAQFAKGTLINHSEHPIPFDQIKQIVARCKELKLNSMVLVPTAKDVLKVAKLNPTFIGVEPPQLIGSTTDSVASMPKLISNAVKNAGKIPLFIGAGVKDKNDLQVGKKLGAKGVLIASAIVKAKDQKKALLSLIQ